MPARHLLTALTVMVSSLSLAQSNCCQPPPTVTQINSDGTHTILVNIPSTSMYLNPNGGGASLVPCGTMVTFNNAITQHHQAMALPTTSFEIVTETESRKPKVAPLHAHAAKQKKSRVKKVSQNPGQLPRR